jgi:tetratricopeptide (TPR) repeat protein
MGKKRKSLLYIAGGVIFLMIIFLLVRFNSYNNTSRKIPKISESVTLSNAVKEQISDALKKARRNPSAENIGMLGMVYHSSANYAEAAQCYQLATERSKSDWIWNYYNGYLNMEMGNSDEVIKNFTIVIEKNPEINLAWYYLGDEYKNLRNNEMAEKSFEKITIHKSKSSSSNKVSRQDHFPLGTYATFELSRIYFDSGRIELAEKTLNGLIQSNNLFGAAYKLLGNIYSIYGDTALGKKFIVRANDLLDLSPPVDTLMDKLVLLSRSELYLLKKIDEAEKSFHSDWALRLVNQGLQYMPDNNYLISKAIKIYLWKNLNDQAIALTDKHLKLFWENFAEIKNTGIFFFQKGIYTVAAKYWTRALELKPGEPLIQEYLAKCLWTTGDKQKSLEILNSIIEKNKDNPDIIADATVLLIQFGAREAAAENLARLKKMAPSNPKVQKISGEIAQANGEIQNAITFYESAFKGDTQDVETIKNLGELYLKKQMWNKYISLFRTALQYHPNNPDFLARLGETLISCPVASFQNIEEGKYYAERAFTYYNCPPDVIIAAGSHLAYAYSLLGDKQKAITTISQTINIGRRQNIPASQQAKLEEMLSVFRNMNN